MKAVIYGAGNIGRGFIGQLLSQSGYEVVFLDINQSVIKMLNDERRYPICIVSNDGNEEFFVENVRAVDSSVTEDVINEIVTADVMATSVGANVLKFIAKPIALAIEKRIELQKPPLNILLCENLLDADKFLKTEIFKYLSVKAQASFCSNVGLVEASIGRMVPVLPKKEGEHPLKVYVEEFDILHLDKNGFVGKVPEIKNILLFSPFNFYMQRKLLIHNMCHAMSAYLGAVKGYEYINQAISDIQIKYLVNMAGISSARAIAADNKADINNLMDFLYKLIYRFNNAELKDTVLRVGRDPIRKLNKNDRIVGAYILCKKHNISTIYICVCIAAALCFKNKEDAVSLSIQKNINKNGILQALKDISGYDGYDTSDLELILVLYGMIKTGDLKNVIDTCEKLQASKIANI